MPIRLVVPIIAFGLLDPIAAIADDHPPAELPSFGTELDTSNSALRPAIERFREDRRTILRYEDQPLSTARSERLTRFDRRWLDDLEGVDFESLDRDGQVDAMLFRSLLKSELRGLEIAETRREEIAPLVPFAAKIVALQAARERIEPIDPKALATELADLADEIDAAREAISEGRSPGGSEEGEDHDDAPAIKKAVANRAAGAVSELRGTLRRWHGFYDGYDPLFTWWTDEPYKKADAALESYADTIRRKLVGKSGDNDNDREIIGDPIGREAILADLESEMIPYTPEELIQIARKELAWCDAEMKKAASEMGFGDDWKAALEEVKTHYVEPGDQPRLVKDLADEAIEFLEDRDLITIPDLARRTWTMRMMSPEAQLRNPFFLGGESIIVAFPTNTMAHDDKMMSLRGNNRHFARATVFHELIPGHNLQAFMTERYRAYRAPFSTPFWTEGWSLYWELLLWDLDFPRSPEDKVGMLFWRMHRCARIIFSLSFHLGEMTPQECVDFLVDRVGHERANAEAEVRRSFEGGYGPLYQCAYLLGGLQLRALHRELVEDGDMSDREFHDAVLRLNSIPIAMVRASLSPDPIDPEAAVSWRFYPLDDGEPEAGGIADAEPTEDDRAKPSNDDSGDENVKPETSDDGR